MSDSEIREEPVIIQFDFRSRLDYSNPIKCRHNHIIVSESLWSIECAECGEKLDPIGYLINLAKDERLIEYRINKLQEQEQKIKDRVRTKCDHCGRMTSI